jgi:hypothetical protein
MTALLVICQDFAMAQTRLQMMWNTGYHANDPHTGMPTPTLGCRPPHWDVWDSDPHTGMSGIPTPTLGCLGCRPPHWDADPHTGRPIVAMPTPLPRPHQSDHSNLAIPTPHWREEAALWCHTPVLVGKIIHDMYRHENLPLFGRFQVFL